MEAELIELLSRFRLATGYLGEREQYGWWQSSFFTQGSEAFLSPLFSRTQVLAQCNGVTRAASIIHDERIGVGNVYHLFRLPEEIELNIHKKLHEFKPEDTYSTKESALDYLRKNSIKSDQSSVGPTRVGDKNSLYELKSWQLVSGLYLYAFEKSVEIYPYFSEIL